jgi:hypothetical protein
MANQKNTKKTPDFLCEICDFKCSRKAEYKRHLETNKHKMLTDANKKTPNDKLLFFNCICGNKYNHKSSFSRHKGTCIIYKSSKEECENNDTIYDNIVADNTDNTDNTDDDEVLKYKEKNKKICQHKHAKNIKDKLVLKLIKDNSEMMKIIKGQQEQINSIIPKIGNTTNNNTTNNTMNNTTNNFNLNVFLNEKCKDALNISDFIDSLKITLDDLLFSKKNGISRGITDVMIKGLKELDVYKRPIHCTDIKRDVMYIKDEDKWHKDDNHDKMKNTIVKIADKERTALQLWANDNPDWIETEQKQIEYLTMVRSICEPIENYENYERKIIKHIEKEIIVDKNS